MHHSTDIRSESAWGRDDTPYLCIGAQSLARHIGSNAAFICRPTPQRVVLQPLCVRGALLASCAAAFADKNINPHLTTRRLMKSNHRSAHFWWVNEVKIKHAHTHAHTNHKNRCCTRSGVKLCCDILLGRWKVMCHFEEGIKWSYERSVLLCALRFRMMQNNFINFFEQ